MGLMDFLSPEAGQARRRWLEDTLSYYIPPELAGPLGLLQMANPVAGVERASGASQEMFAPGATAGERLRAGGDMALELAGVVAPAAAARYVGRPAAEALQEGLLGFTNAADAFAADEFGGLRISSAVTDPAIQRADEVLGLLKSGRADEVTDAMLDMGDPVLNARMSQHLWDNYDLPMDFESRMARADAMGKDTAAYHATRSDVPFSSFSPGVRGSVYMAATPQGAEAGASGQILEDYGAGAVQAVLPLKVSSQDIAGLSVNRAVFDALPEKITDEATIKEIAPRVRQAGLQYWDDAYEAVPFGDEYRYYKREIPAVSYQDVEPGKDAFGYRLGGFNSGSDVASLERVRDQGRRGFLVADEGGSSIVAAPDMPIRSRFARFDPRLSHLRNLNAALAAGVPLGLLSMTEEEQY